jgi:dTDP-4-amino-4,6-dideoxygalactose transaminase
MSILAINGGQKVRTRYFPKSNNIGKEEKEAVANVMDSGLLSGYRGNWTEAFFGGPEVRSLERMFAEKFHVHHAIACNSCTSALHIACMIIDPLTRLSPFRDQVIVSPWSMSCSASAPWFCSLLPRFADVEKDYFCLDHISVKENITDRTRAIIVVDLFGQPYNKEAINEIAKEHSLFVIEDAAQAIGSTYNNEYAGTLGDIGVFSFTQGKILFAGEGGMIVTNNDRLAMKCRLIMNHAESVINDMSKSERNMKDIDESMCGFNMRMTEIQAAIIKCQLKKLDKFIEMRRRNVQKINKIFEQIPVLDTFPIRDKCTHSYYCHSFKWNHEEASREKSGTKYRIFRDQYIKAVISELMPEEDRLDKAMLGYGYTKPLDNIPLFQYIFWNMKLPTKRNHVTLQNVEDLSNKELCINMYHGLPLEEEDFLDIEKAFMKVWEHRSEL